MREGTLSSRSINSKNARVPTTGVLHSMPSQELIERMLHLYSDAVGGRQFVLAAAVCMSKQKGKDFKNFLLKMRVQKTREGYTLAAVKNMYLHWDRIAAKNISEGNEQKAAFPMATSGWLKAIHTILENAGIVE